jgi:flagellar biosynthetic protein FliR
VTSIGPPAVLATFVIFCRVGTCLMLMPGFSSARVGARVRLFLAIAITLVLTPLLLPTVQPLVVEATPDGLATLIVSEMMIGASIGILGQLFFMALETLGTVATMAIGYGPVPGVAIEDNQPQPALVSILTMSAVLLLFVTGQYWEVLRGLTASYVAMPVARLFSAELALSRVVGVLTDAFLLALRISSPFIIYAVVVNFALGLANKLTPQIPVYFISLPFVLAGGLLLLYFIAPEMLNLFIDGFGEWLSRG